MSVYQPFRILVVDDNAIDQRIEALMLTPLQQSLQSERLWN
jgi:CheY-like chemotaxis protein